MHDPAYKQLFARPRMVRDLLEGFAARGWSGSLDFGTLEPLPASYVSRDLQQRHGDLVWRLRFSDERWLYLLLLLEFQSTVDRAMAVRMLAYTALLYQRLAADGALRDPGALPPVLPVVIYNGRGSWTAPTDVNELVAGGRGELSPYQPSQRYFLLDESRLADDELPAGNLVSALIGLEKGRDPAWGAARLQGPFRALIDLLEGEEDEELRRAFATWINQVVGLAERLPDEALGPLEQLKETYTMLEETVQGWVERGRIQGVEQGRVQGIEQGRVQGIEQGRVQGIEQGRVQGIEQGRNEERALLCRQAARKFGADTSERLTVALAGVSDPDRLAQVGDWIIECATAADLIGRVLDQSRPGD